MLYVVQTVPAFAPTFTQHIRTMLEQCVLFKRCQHLIQHSPNILGHVGTILCLVQTVPASVDPTFTQHIRAMLEQCCVLFKRCQRLIKHSPKILGHVGTICSNNRPTFLSYVGKMLCVVQTVPAFDPTLAQQFWSVLWGV